MQGWRRDYPATENTEFPTKQGWELSENRGAMFTSIQSLMASPRSESTPLGIGVLDF